MSINGTCRNKRQKQSGNQRQKRTESRGRRLRLVLLSAVLILALLLAAGILLLRRMPVKPTVLTTDIEAEWEAPSFYQQDDPGWGADRMGESSDTMKQSGCLVTCIAASMEIQESREDAAFRLTPGELNRELSGNGVYDGTGNVLWEPLRECFPEWEILTPSSVESGEVEQMFLEGACPIVKVRMPVSRVYHWVLLLKAEQGEYYCMDPLDYSEEPVPLSKFHNEAYAVRILRPKT